VGVLDFEARRPSVYLRLSFLQRDRHGVVALVLVQDAQAADALPVRPTVHVPRLAVPLAHLLVDVIVFWGAPGRRRRKRRRRRRRRGPPGAALLQLLHDLLRKRSPPLINSASSPESL